MHVFAPAAGARPPLSAAAPAPPSAPAPAEPAAPVDRPPARDFQSDDHSVKKTLAGVVLGFMSRRIPTTVPEITPEKAKELNEKLKPGDVILTCDCAYPGWARMEFYTVRSNYTHAAYYGGDGKIYEATGGGVLESKLDGYWNGRMKVAVIRPPYQDPEGDVKAAVDWCKKQVGKRYDNVFDTGDDSEFYCSELVFKALKNTPHPIDSPSRELMGKTAVAPDAFLYIPGIAMVHDDKSTYWGNKIGHWPIAACAVGGAVAGGLLAGTGGAVAGFGVGLVGSILGWNKLQTGYYSPSLHDFKPDLPQVPERPA